MPGPRTGLHVTDDGQPVIQQACPLCVIATVVLRATARAVCLAFVAAMQEHGIPGEVLSDNGKQFTGRFGRPRPVEVLFERICRENGITQRLTRPQFDCRAGCGAVASADVDVASSSADDWLRLNRAWWDERAPVHAASGFYDVPGFLAGKDSLRAFEPGEVGDVRGKRLLHLMCHIGLDTLSWARRGAIVTGLDFSQPALDTAASLARRAGISSARFITAEIGDASRALAGQTFDIVYTGTGVTQWIPDIGSWARTVAALVTPGGFFYIADYHPLPDSFDIVDGEVRRLRHGYLDHGPWAVQAGGTYTGPAQTSANTFMKWNHHIGSIVNALAAAGLRIEFLHEYDFTDAPFHGLERSKDGLWRIPAGRFQIPLLFSLRAAKDPVPEATDRPWSTRSSR